MPSAQMTKAKSRTETVTAYDKKAKKFITHKESYQTYNSNGDVIEEFGYDKKGVVNKHIKYEYNSFGKKTKEIHYKDNTSSIKFLVEFVYDSRGLKIEELEKAGVSPHLNIFYSIEMGLQGKSWNEINSNEKNEIKKKKSL